MKNLVLATLFVLYPVLCAAQEPQSQVPTPNFVYLRMGSSSATLVNYNRTFKGNKVVWLGTLQDLTVDPTYREFQVGLGQAFGASQVFALVLKASDGWYLQLVGLPNFTFGKVSVSAFVAEYIPLQEGGVRQFLLDPVTVLVALNTKLAIGGSYTLWKPAGGGWKDTVGPTLQVALPKGSLNINFFKGLRNSRSEIRVTYAVAF